MSVPDLMWLVEACGDNKMRMAELSLVLATSAVGQTAVPGWESEGWVLEYRKLIRELERRVLE
jgi:hypothetical protein